MNGIRKTSGRAAFLGTAAWLRDRMIEDMLEQLVYPCDADDFDLIELLDMGPSVVLKNKEAPWGAAPWEKGSNDRHNGKDG